MRPEWFAWYNMHQRCYNRRVKNYRNYGGRGIIVEDRWHSYKNFLSDMGAKPSKEHSLDRIDNDGNYGTENCRWALPWQQTDNRRNGGLHFVQKNNSSGLIGVGYREKVDRWEAYVRYNYKHKRLYWGSDFFEACCARKSWESRHANG
jgi:hypothetical protein